jgi:hypothetical protein
MIKKLFTLLIVIGFATISFATTNDSVNVNGSGQTGTGSFVMSASPSFTGNVGIGSTAPGSTLDIQGVSRILGTGQLQIGAGSLSGNLEVNGFSNFTDGTEAIFVNGNSNSNIFDLLVTNANGGSGAAAVINLTNNSNTPSQDGYFGINSSTYSSSGSVALANETYVSSYAGDLGFATLANKSIHFQTNNSSSDTMTIAGSNVGIGTTLPLQTFTVIGNVGIGTTISNTLINNALGNGVLYVQGNVGIGTWVTADKLQVSGGNIIGQNGGKVNDGTVVCGNSTVAGTAVGTGTTPSFTYPTAGKIISATISGTLSASNCSCTVDVWKTNAAIPTVTNTITSSDLPALSSGTYHQDTTLTGWTTSIAANDVIMCNVQSCTCDNWNLVLGVSD